MVKLTILLVIGLFSHHVFAEDGDKLDLKQLDDKYWAAKDSDFMVIQNRTFTKDKRWYLSTGYGVLVNDPYVTGKIFTLGGGYYFNEHWGIQVSHDASWLADNSATSQFASSFTAKPNYIKGMDYNSVSALWIPLYAKMSAMDKAIWYFDLQFALGLGVVDYQNQIDPTEGSNMNQSTIGVNFDTTAHIFFSRNWAFRLDLKNVFANEDLQRYHQTGSGQSSRDMGSSVNWDTKFQVGITYFFGSSGGGTSPAATGSGK